MLPAASADACVFADMGFDPGWLGCQSFDVTDFVLNARRFDADAVLILWQIALTGDRSLRVFESDSRRIALLAEVLMEDYPPDHMVTVYCAATLPIGAALVETLPLSRLAEAKVTQESTLIIPPLGAAKPSAKRLALVEERLAGL